MSNASYEQAIKKQPGEKNNQELIKALENECRRMEVQIDTGLKNGNILNETIRNIQYQIKRKQNEILLWERIDMTWEEVKELTEAKLVPVDAIPEQHRNTPVPVSFHPNYINEFLVRENADHFLDDLLYAIWQPIDETKSWRFIGINSFQLLSK